MPNKFLLIFSISIILFLIFDSATAAEPMWPDCIAGVTQSFSLRRSISNYESIGCTYNAFVVISTDISTENNLSAPLVIDIIRGSVTSGASNGLSLICPDYSFAATALPQHITITNIHFGTNSMLQILGTLPPSSSIVVSDNQFELNAVNTMASLGSLYSAAIVAAISLGRSTMELTVSESSTISVHNNTAIAGAATVTAVVHLASRAISVNNNSRLAATSNTLIPTYGHIINAVLWSNPSLRVSVSNTSTVEIDGNLVHNRSASSFAVYAVYFQSVGNLEIAVDSNSSLSFSNNALHNRISSRASTVSFEFASLTARVTEHSAWTMDNNTAVNMESSNLGAVIAIVASSTLWLEVTSGANMSISGNSLLHSTSVSLNSPYMHVVTIGSGGAVATVNVSSGSTFRVEGNRGCHLNTSTFVIAVYWLASDTSFQIGDQSLMTFTTNIIEDSVGGESVFAVYLQSGRFVLGATRHSVLSMSDNEVARNDAKANVITVICVGNPMLELDITQSSQFNASNNRATTVSAVDNINAFSLLVLPVQPWPEAFLRFAVSNGSSATFAFNRIAQSSASTGQLNTIVWSSAAQILAVGSNSTITFRENHIRSSYTRTSAIVVYTHAPNSFLTISCLSTITITDNEISNVTLGGNAIVVYFSAVNQEASNLTIGGDSFFIVTKSLISDCNLTSVGVATVFWLSTLSNVSVSNTSSMEVCFNTIRNVSTRGNIYTVYFLDLANIVVASNSSLVIKNNQLFSCTRADTISILYAVSRTLRLFNRSSMIVCENLLDLSVKTTTPASTFQHVSLLSLYEQNIIGSEFVLRGESQWIIRSNVVTTEGNDARASQILSLMAPLVIESGSWFEILLNTFSIDTSYGAALWIGTSMSFNRVGGFRLSGNKITIHVHLSTCPSSMASFGTMIGDSGLNFIELTNNAVTVLSAWQPEPQPQQCESMIEFGMTSSIATISIMNNTFTSDVFQFTILFNDLWLPASGELTILNNTANFTSGGQNAFVRIQLTLSLTKLAVVRLEKNTISCASTSPCKFIDAGEYIDDMADPMAKGTVTYCMNFINRALNGHPATFLAPADLSSIARLDDCDGLAQFTRTQSLISNSRTESSSRFLSASTPSNLASWSSSASSSLSFATNSSSRSSSLLPSASREDTSSPELIHTATYREVVRPPIVPVPAVVETAKQVTNAASVVVAVTAVASVTGGQLGVANAMIRLADCTDSEDGEDSLPILVHPLQFKFGDLSYQKNAAGAISNTILVPLIVTLVALGPVRLLIMRFRAVPSRTAMAQMGWPSLLIMPFTNLAEGIGTTIGNALVSGEPFGIGIGFVAGAILVAFAGSWVWMLVRLVPRRRLTLQQEENSPLTFSADKRRVFLMRIVRPTHRWAPMIEPGVRPLANNFVERYSNAIGDKQWYYAEFLSFLCSVAVGAAESLPSTICRERVIIALVPALLQCGLAVLALIPLERFLQSLLALCLVPMYIVVSVKVFTDKSDGDDLLDSAMAVFSSASNVIGIFIMALSLVMGLWEIVTTHRHVNRKGTRVRRRASSTQSSQVESLAVPFVTSREESVSEGPPSVVGMADVNFNSSAHSFHIEQHEPPKDGRSPVSAEQVVVQNILSQLREYESNLDL